jgi:hypothetical protein
MPPSAASDAVLLPFSVSNDAAVWGRLEDGDVCCIRRQDLKSVVAGAASGRITSGELRDEEIDRPRARTMPNGQRRTSLLPLDAAAAGS